MKKNIVTWSFIAAFIAYSLYQRFGISGTTVYVATDTSAPIAPVAPATVTLPKPAPPAKKITPSSAPKPAPTPPPAVAVKNSIYADGTYTGNVADAYYGNIQVQATIQNGRIANVQFLQYPSDRDRSIRINGMAMPILKSEAISAQSANVDIVSGATDSSQAFVQSLSSALAQARNL